MEYNDLIDRYTGTLYPQACLKGFLLHLFSNHFIYLFKQKFCLCT